MVEEIFLTNENKYLTTYSIQIDFHFVYFPPAVCVLSLIQIIVIIIVVVAMSVGTLSTAHYVGSSLHRLYSLNIVFCRKFTSDMENDAEHVEDF